MSEILCHICNKPYQSGISSVGNVYSEEVAATCMICECNTCESCADTWWDYTDHLLKQCNTCLQKLWLRSGTNSFKEEDVCLYKLQLLSIDPHHVSQDKVNAYLYDICKKHPQNLLDLLEKFVAFKPNWNYIDEKTGLSLLDVTLAGKGLKFILDNGGDPNKCNAGGISPLYRALESGDRQTFSLFLDNGAKLEDSPQFLKLLQRRESFFPIVDRYKAKQGFWNRLVGRFMLL